MRIRLLEAGEIVVLVRAAHILDIFLLVKRRGAVANLHDVNLNVVVAKILQVRVVAGVFLQPGAYLHSFTFQLNVSTFHGDRGCV